MSQTFQMTHSKRVRAFLETNHYNLVTYTRYNFVPCVSAEHILNSIDECKDAGV